MQIGIITARDPEYHPNRRFLEAGALLGVEVALLHPFHIWSGLAGGRPLTAGLEGLKSFDLLLPRVGATISDYSLTLLKQLELMGLKLVNGSQAIAICRHKFLTLQTLSAAGLPVLDTYLVNSLEGYAGTLKRLQGPPLVVKLVSSRQGSGVFLVEDDSPDPALGDEKLSQVMEQRHGVLVQSYLAPLGRRDIRVVTLGDDQAWAMEIEPAPGEFRANVHLGGVGRAVPADGEMLDLAQRARQAVGLEIAGVDLMQAPDGSWWLGEVNFTPGFKGLEEATGQDIAVKILEFSLQKAKV